MKIFAHSSGYGGASLFDKLFFTWIKPYIDRSHKPELIAFDECGSLRQKEMLPTLFADFQDTFKA
jgi:hypothetical protein